MVRKRNKINMTINLKSIVEGIITGLITTILYDIAKVLWRYLSGFELHPIRLGVFEIFQLIGALFCGVLIGGVGSGSTGEYIDKVLHKNITNSWKFRIPFFVLGTTYAWEIVNSDRNSIDMFMSVLKPIGGFVIAFFVVLTIEEKFFKALNIIISPTWKIAFYIIISAILVWLMVMY
jgi:hypothetical protein